VSRQLVYRCDLCAATQQVTPGEPPRGWVALVLPTHEGPVDLCGACADALDGFLKTRLPRVATRGAA